MIDVNNYIITCAKQAVKIELMEEAIDVLKFKVEGQMQMIVDLEAEAEAAHTAQTEQEGTDG